jgi:hypothetical protein
VADEFEIKLPDHLEEGVYANAIRPWHTRTEFTLDFLTQPANQESDIARVVSRIKIPTIFMFPLIQRLSVDITDYEQRYGEIR